jgi:ABC-2 type transport system ATP-binding protein
LIAWASLQRGWAIGFLDEVWWSRFALPRMYAWQSEDHPVHLVEQPWKKADPDPKALACYGVLWQQGPADDPIRKEMSLRFVTGRPVSDITTQFLEWCCTRLQAQGKTAWLLIWDNASWHYSKLVRTWIRERNRASSSGRGKGCAFCLYFSQSRVPGSIRLNPNGSTASVMSSRLMACLRPRSLLNASVLTLGAPMKLIFLFPKRPREYALGSIRSVVDPDVREVMAVQDLSLSVERGEMIGLVGPNGAGKSTTIKMLTGILVPSGGEMSVVGLNPLRQRRELASHIGVVFGQRSQLWWDLPLIDSLRLLRHLYRVPEARFNANLAQLRSMLGLDEFIDTPVRQLSLGQRMRGDLAAALLHDPELLYLDEPTIGLDVVAKARIREFLLKINAERGATILLTTHDMDDVETLCQRMLIVDHGRKLYDGSVGDIRERFGGERTLVAVLDPAQLASLPRGAGGQLIMDDLPAGVRLLRAEEPRIWLGFSRDAIAAHELVAWLGTRYRLHDVTFQEPEIEDIIRRIYEEGLLLEEAGKS